MSEAKTSVAQIGERIGLLTAIMQVLAAEMLTDEDIAAFRQYLQVQQAIGFVYDPTAYRHLLQIDGFEQTQDRLQVIDAVRSLPINDPDGIEVLRMRLQGLMPLLGLPFEREVEHDTSSS